MRRKTNQRFAPPSLPRAPAHLTSMKRRAAASPRPPAKRSATSPASTVRTHSLLPIISLTVPPEVLILGTHPSRKSLAESLSEKEVRMRGGAGPQNYGHSQNIFWNVAGSACGFSRHAVSYEKQCEAFTARGCVLWDVVRSCVGKGSLDSDIDKSTMEANDIPGLLSQHPTIRRICIAKTAAAFLCHSRGHAAWLKTGEAAGRRWDFVLRTASPATAETASVLGKYCRRATGSEIEAAVQKERAAGDGALQRTVELVVLPSTSPANAAMSPDAKEKVWHRAAYGYERAPAAYRCVGCGAVGEHWFVDCDRNEEWRRQQMEKKTRGDLFVEEVDGDRWLYSKPKA